MDEPGTTTTRSRANPAIDLEAAVDLLEGHVERFGMESRDRESVIDKMGYKSNSGWAARLLAAMGQYDLLERRKGRYSPTGLAERMLHASDPESLQALRVEALRKPPLYREIIDEYSGTGTVPGNLPDLLVEHHGISEAAKNDVANTFVTSAVYAGLISRSGAFLIEEADPVIYSANARARPERRRRHAEVAQFQRRAEAKATTQNAFTIEDVSVSRIDEEYSQIKIKIPVPNSLDLGQLRRLAEAVESFAVESFIANEEDESRVVDINERRSTHLKWG